MDALALAHALTDACEDVRRMPLLVALSLLRLGRHCPSLAARLKPALEPKLKLLLPRLPAAARTLVLLEMDSTPIALGTMPRQDVMPQQHTAAALATGTERPAKRPRLKRPRPALGCTPRPARLSDHAMWTSSQRYYISRGLAAFTSGEVPHEISTSRLPPATSTYYLLPTAYCLLPTAYHLPPTTYQVPHEISTSRFLGTGLAALVLAFWADADARRRAEEGGGAEAGGGEGGEGGEAEDSTRYVVELGCGSGLLSLHCAAELRRRGAHRCCVVLADLDPSAALQLCASARGASLVAEGWLDVARLHGDGGDGGDGGGGGGGAGGRAVGCNLPEGGALQLLISGREIAPASLCTPLVLLLHCCWHLLEPEP